ncbi:MAG: MGMT family protein [Nanoarchaeota archaeon]
MFQEKVWQLCRKIPRGRVTTYKILGDKLKTKAYRAVGQALKRNPYAPLVPCHRVVASDGKLGGFMGQKVGKCLSKKIALLKKEGIHVQNGRIKNFEQKIWY